jgi:hypothetical protein
MDQPDAPGAKTSQNCPWWATNSPDQGQIPRKTAPGAHLTGLTMGKKPRKVPLVKMFKEYSILQMPHPV